MILKNAFSISNQLYGPFFFKKDRAQRFHPSTFDIRHSAVRFLYQTRKEDKGLDFNQQPNKNDEVKRNAKYAEKQI